MIAVKNQVLLYDIFMMMIPWHINNGLLLLTLHRFCKHVFFFEYIHTYTYMIDIINIFQTYITYIFQNLRNIQNYKFWYLQHLCQVEKIVREVI